MYPILFHFGFITIYSYGLMVAIAFLVSAFLLSQYAARLGLHKEFFWNLSFWMLWGGILGGRILYIILNLGYFIENPLELIMLWHGGLVWYGGFAGGLIAGALYIKSHQASLLDTLDIIMPFVALGHSIGRIGCFLNGCCYGPAELIVPSQIFSSLSLLGIFIALRLLQERPHPQGSIVAAYLLIASLERFVEEFLRNDSARSFWGLTIFQVISVGIFIIAILLWSMILWQQKKTRGNG